MVWDTEYSTEENAEKIKKILGDKIEVSSVWGGWSGPQAWNFIDGPTTLGIVPAEYCGMRLKELKIHADFAKALGASNLVTHVGFIPENPIDAHYRALVQAAKEIAGYCRELGLDFNFETGQETPITLRRTIMDLAKLGFENVGVNFDPANIILYGKGNPVDAIDIYGDKIKGVHVKDGEYPIGDCYALGIHKVVGEGAVNYPVFLPKLLKRGYTGDLYIDREITGEQQIIDIKKTVKYVTELIESMNNE